MKGSGFFPFELADDPFESGLSVVAGLAACSSDFRTLIMDMCGRAIPPLSKRGRGRMGDGEV